MTRKQTIVITGASRGIGLLTSKTLAARGHHVVATMRDLDGRNRQQADALRSWAAAHGHTLDVLDMDISSEDAVQAAFAAIEAQRPVDVLINNAGVMPVGLTEGFTPNQIAESIDINVLGVARTCRAALPYMRTRRKGLLIHLSSAAGRLAIPFFGVYCASKWALEAYAETLQYEVSGFGIESVIVEPSGHSTDLVKSPPGPADATRAPDYGEVAQGPATMLQNFENMFAQGLKVTDAQNVADKIYELIDTAAPRPLRLAVGHDMGVTALNAGAAPAQARFTASVKPLLHTERLPSEQSQTDERLYLFAKIPLKPEHYRQAKAALTEILPATLQEPGCQVFSLFEGTEADNSLFLFEVFVSEAALQHHYDQPYTKDVFAQYEQWLRSPVEITRMRSGSYLSSNQFAS